MYNEQILNQKCFFKEYLSNHDIKEALDDLTGLINRNIFVSFVRDCIDKRTPFSFIIFDIDNYKLLLDNYGDKIGHLVIQSTAKSLFDYVEDKGLLSRWEGDRFALILFDILEYDEIHSFLQTIMHNGKIFRKNVNCGGLIAPFITSTMAAISYPKDTDSYDDLFEKLDKLIFRGKDKGRNCFIIWVKEKHQNLVINKEKDSIDLIVKKLFDMFESKVTYSVGGDDIPYIFNFIKEKIKVDFLLYVSSDYKVYDSSSVEVLGKIKNIDDSLDGENSISFNYNSDVMSISSELYFIFDDLGISSSYILKMNKETNFYGYFILASKRTSRIWSSEEKLLLFLLAKLYSRYIDDTSVVGLKKYGDNKKGL